MTRLELIETIALAIFVLCLVVYYFVKAIKNKWLEQITDTVKAAIKEAEEKYPEGHGAEKKELVLEAVEAKCMELGIPYAFLKKLINKLIENIVKNYNVIAKK